MNELTETSQPGERLQKVLAQAGIGSRREMEEWISAGRVTVNGTVATLGMRVSEGDKVQVDGRVVRLQLQAEQALPRILLYHKQEGEIVSRDDPNERASVFDSLPKLRGTEMDRHRAAGFQYQRVAHLYHLRRIGQSLDAPAFRGGARICGARAG